MTVKADHHKSRLKALVYCRVSSVKQRIEGAGLQSQEHRCRKFADEHGWHVEMVFPDDVSGRGDFMDRPGMRAMLAYLEAKKGQRYVVIFDDLRRFARDTEFHLKLRRELASRGADVKCLNFEFDDSPEGRFVEVIMAASGQMEREQIARQNRQKSIARLEGGYWVFKAPLGYKYVRDKERGGKKLVLDEPLATVIRNALEGYASGRFGSQAEVQRFLEADPFFPKDKKDGTLRPMTVKRLLEKVIYAGYVESTKWGVSLRKGKHEGLISFHTHQRVREVMAGKKRRAAARSDYYRDFPLRDHMECDHCGRKITGSWSKGCRQRYAYYTCPTRGCKAKGKSIPRAVVHQQFAEIMKSIQPSPGFFELAKKMLCEAWDKRWVEAKTAKFELSSQLKENEKQIDLFLNRILDVSSATVLKSFETRVDELERERILLTEKRDKILPPKGKLEDCIELALRLLSNPWELYKNSDYEIGQSVLKLVFPERLKYDRSEGYRTPIIAFPFRVLAEMSKGNSDMVLLERIELSTSPLPRECSTSELQQRRGRLIRLKRNGVQGYLDGFFLLLYRRDMADKDTPRKKAKTEASREDRLKAALKANLGRRKAQARARTVQSDGNEKSES